MPIEEVEGASYYLVCCDKRGREREDDRDGLMSQRVVDIVRQQRPSDVFVFSHGWKGDVPDAQAQYANWIRAMLGCGRDRDAAKATRRPFRPLLVGFHWPSQPWGDEALGGGDAFSVETGASADALIEAYADCIADTPRARAAIRKVFDAALENMMPDWLSEDVVEAYQALYQEAGLEPGAPGGPSGPDGVSFDPGGAYVEAREIEEEARFSLAGSMFGGVLVGLRQLSFWKMKNRAREVGGVLGHTLVRQLMDAAPADARFHLMGHSFGCIVASAMVTGPGGRRRLPRPVYSVALVQGALSIWAYCRSLPFDPAQAGYFRAVLESARVLGPIVTTHSCHDTAVGKFYPLGAGLFGQTTFAPGELPRVAGLGAYGIQGVGDLARPMAVLPADGRYNFRAGTVYNLDADDVIKNGDGPSGAHSDIAHTEIAHAVWEAALSPAL